MAACRVDLTARVAILATPVRGFSEIGAEPADQCTDDCTARAARDRTANHGADTGSGCRFFRRRSGRQCCGRENGNDQSFHFVDPLN